MTTADLYDNTNIGVLQPLSPQSLPPPTAFLPRPLVQGLPLPEPPWWCRTVGDDDDAAAVDVGLVIPDMASTAGGGDVGGSGNNITALVAVAVDGDGDGDGDGSLNSNCHSNMVDMGRDTEPAPLQYGSYNPNQHHQVQLRGHVTNPPHHPRLHDMLVLQQYCGHSHVSKNDPRVIPIASMIHRMNPFLPYTEQMLVTSASTAPALHQGQPEWVRRGSSDGGGGAAAAAAAAVASAGPPTTYVLQPPPSSPSPPLPPPPPPQAHLAMNSWQLQPQPPPPPPEVSFQRSEGEGAAVGSRGGGGGGGGRSPTAAAAAAAAAAMTDDDANVGGGGSSGYASDNGMNSSGSSGSSAPSAGGLFDPRAVRSPYTDLNHQQRLFRALQLHHQRRLELQVPYDMLTPRLLRRRSQRYCMSHTTAGRGTRTGVSGGAAAGAGGDGGGGGLFEVGYGIRDIS
ncbi:hypothetical protein VOLCADRAFT_91017 [Volvox carteri f. nagariensis]|uniref:Uncharacterized protein n=1 Tax=Volvox carteri f. nagariensis TaxID=3068 RepID=D8TVY8_VOLCA|nr:uncharacterized protein VOLCADRAFT_91017 [Volvox carteri f. nagariensis]EFJ48275.1 hypothetical protein VOLCADRAFT_91017 [Volvox carteri f. nagariensis]|eukprot:XP_002950529.1 hypothetical protein VOLCADRAFT_91017 [Volvox carteri f. nagariensis]